MIGRNQKTNKLIKKLNKLKMIISKKIMNNKNKRLNKIFSKIIKNNSFNFNKKQFKNKTLKKTKNLVA